MQAKDIRLSDLSAFDKVSIHVEARGSRIIFIGSD
jgi:hypothetical protein